MNDAAATPAPDRDDLRRLTQTKVFFAHQSVGQNIVDGMRALLAEYSDLNWPLIDYTGGALPQGGAFLHARVGRNTDPRAKLADYAAAVNGAIGAECRFSALKFCYVDITAATDVDTLFAEYMEQVRRLGRNRPDHTLVHMTVPLTVSRSSWKTWLKQFALRQHIWQFDDNIVRNAWNDKMRRQWANAGTLFDLATLESAGTGDLPASFTKYGQRYAALAPEISSDGGHLNAVGQRLIANAWLHFLCGLL